MEVGRNMKEIKRAVIALQTAERNDAIRIPANWEPGDDVILHNYSKETLTDPDVYQVAWFLTFIKKY
jgi:alkyl hydroperoxide reductase subunit AhpC